MNQPDAPTLPLTDLMRWCANAHLTLDEALDFVDWASDRVGDDPEIVERGWGRLYTEWQNQR